MATLTSYYFLDMNQYSDPTASSNDPAVSTTIQNTTQIQAMSTDKVAAVTLNLYGHFSYDSSHNLTAGTLTGMNVYAYGSKFFEMTGMNLAMQNSSNYSVFFQNFLLGNDTINGSFQNDRLNGFSGNDILYGNGGADELIGSDGNDTLIGGTGKDTLIGGLGADIFSFKATNETAITSTSADIISDFKSYQLDKIDISAIDANNSTVLNDAFKFIGSAGFSSTNATAQLRFDSINHILYGSIDADNSAEFAIQLTGITSLTTSNLTL